MTGREGPALRIQRAPSGATAGFPAPRGTRAWAGRRGSHSGARGVNTAGSQWRIGLVRLEADWDRSLKDVLLPGTRLAELVLRPHADHPGRLRAAPATLLEPTMAPRTLPCRCPTNLRTTLVDEIGRLDHPSVQWHIAQILQHLRPHVTNGQLHMSPSCAYVVNR